MAYNKRTTSRIKSWMVQFAVRPVHLKVLMAAFKNAWREIDAPTDRGPNFLGIFRSCRTRIWWDSMKDLKYARSKQRIVHAGMGPRCEWEDVFCLAFGSTWRLKRDQCSTERQWLQLFPEFAGLVCKQWGLPLHDLQGALHSPETSPLLSRSKRQRRHDFDLANLPRLHGENCGRLCWDRVAGSFVFIVDCKPVVDILCGRAPLLCSDLKPMYERMTTNLGRLLQSGRRPHELVGDPVLWQRRENNVIADYIVNHTMDRRESWNYTCDGDTPIGANLVCHSDGGRRDESCAGAAWFVETLRDAHGMESCTPLAMRGIFISSSVSSFVAESIALDDAISYICSICV